MLVDGWYGYFGIFIDWLAISLAAAQMDVDLEYLDYRKPVSYGKLS